MNSPRHSEAAFETVIEAHLLQNGYAKTAREGFDRERAIFPETEFRPVELTGADDGQLRVVAELVEVL